MNIYEIGFFLFLFLAILGSARLLFVQLRAYFRLQRSCRKGSQKTGSRQTEAAGAKIKRAPGDPA